MSGKRLILPRTGLEGYLLELSQCESRWNRALESHRASREPSGRLGLLIRRLLARLPGFRDHRRAEAIASFLLLRHGRAIAAFLQDESLELAVSRRALLLAKTLIVSTSVECLHEEEEVIAFFRAVLSLPRNLPGVLVEAGAFKGGATAKLSVVAHHAGRELFVFDSFSGRRGRGPETLHDARRNVRRFGCLRRCRFVPGRFGDTMPGFRETVAAAYLDAGSLPSTRCAVRHLYPLLTPGGRLVCHDGHIAQIVRLFHDPRFWRAELGCAPPQARRLANTKLLIVCKPKRGPNVL